eukprot:RCo014567
MQCFLCKQPGHRADKCPRSRTREWRPVSSVHSRKDLHTYTNNNLRGKDRGPASTERDRGTERSWRAAGRSQGGRPETSAWSGSTAEKRTGRSNFASPHEPILDSPRLHLGRTSSHSLRDSGLLKRPRSPHEQHSEQIRDLVPRSYSAEKIVRRCFAVQPGAVSSGRAGGETASSRRRDEGDFWSDDDSLSDTASPEFVRYNRRYANEQQLQVIAQKFQNSREYLATLSLVRCSFENRGLAELIPALEALIALRELQLIGGFPFIREPLTIPNLIGACNRMGHLILLDLSDNHLFDKDITELSKALQLLPSLRSLALANNRISVHSLSVLIQHMRTHGKIASLDVSNTLMASPESVPLVVDLMLSSICNLNLSGCGLGKVMASLENLLRHSHSSQAGALQALHLENNGITDAGAESLAKLLAHCLSRVALLNLQQNEISDLGFGALLEAAGKRHGPGSETALGLQVLDIEGNQISAAIAPRLAVLVRKAPSLLALYLRCNPIFVDQSLCHTINYTLSSRLVWSPTTHRWFRRGFRSLVRTFVMVTVTYHKIFVDDKADLLVGHILPFVAVTSSNFSLLNSVFSSSWFHLDIED